MPQVTALLALAVRWVTATALTSLSSTGSARTVTFGSAVGTNLLRLGSVSNIRCNQYQWRQYLHQWYTRLYRRGASLGADTNLTTTNSNVSFSSTVDGAHALTVAAGTGTVGFSGTVGNATALTSLSSTGSGAVTFSSAVGTNLLRLGSVSISGATNINGGSVYTSGNQGYTGTISLGADTTLDTGTGTSKYLNHECHQR